MSRWHGGKGSAKRPTDRDKFNDGWDRIFKSKNPKFPEPDLDTEKTEDESGTTGKSETDNG